MEVESITGFFGREEPLLAHGGIIFKLYRDKQCLDEIIDYSHQIGVPIYVTGHSLGAGLAILSMYVLEEPLDGFYAFGTLRLGNESLTAEIVLLTSEEYSNYGTIVINEKDMVARLPPYFVYVPPNILLHERNDGLSNFSGHSLEGYSTGVYKYSHGLSS